MTEPGVICLVWGRVLDGLTKTAKPPGEDYHRHTPQCAIKKGVWFSLDGIGEVFLKGIWAVLAVVEGSTPKQMGSLNLIELLPAKDGCRAEDSDPNLLETARLGQRFLRPPARNPGSRWPKVGHVDILETPK